MVEDKKTDQVVKRDYKSEVEKLISQPSKWTQPKTQYDHLPPHERPFNIQPFPLERNRLPFKMTDEDRSRRQRYIESQTLSDREPVRVNELEPLLLNPIRRLYRAPFNSTIKYLEPTFGAEKARAIRWVVPKLLMGYCAVMIVWYNIKYYNKNWERNGGFRLTSTDTPVLPGQKAPEERKPEDYYDLGFLSRKVFKGSEYSY